MQISKVKKHNRIKPKAVAKPTRLQKYHMDRVASLGCIMTGQPANLHHVMGNHGNVGKYRKLRRRDHRFVCPLSREYHQGDKGVHGLGSEDKFRLVHDVDLIEWAVKEWEKSCELAINNLID